MLGATVIRGSITDGLEHKATSKLKLRTSQMGKLRLSEVRDFPKVNQRVGDISWTSLVLDIHHSVIVSSLPKAPPRLPALHLNHGTVTLAPEAPQCQPDYQAARD